MAIDTQIPPIIGNIVQAPSAQDFFLLKNYSNNYSWLPQSYVEAAIGSVNTIVAGTNISVDSTDPEHPIVAVVASPTFTTVTSTTFTTNVATANISISGSTIAAGGSNTNTNTNIRAKGATGVVVLGDDGNDNWLAGASAFIPGADNTKDLGSASLGIRTAYINTTKTNKITELTALAGVTIATNSIDRWIFNGSGALNPNVDNTYDIGNEAVNPRDIHTSRSFILKGVDALGYGLWKKGYKTASTTFTGGATENIAVQVPAGARIIGAQLRVDTLIVFGGGGVSWSAAYNTGSAQSITTGQVPTKNTKVDKMYDTNVDSDISTGTLDITITPSAGTLDSGAITAIVYYEEFTSMTDAP